MERKIDVTSAAASAAAAPTRQPATYNAPTGLSPKSDASTVAPLEVTAQSMRTVMGHFCTGVVIVAARASDGLLGLTCQSFSSLSLDPPLISLNIARTSQSWPRIRQQPRFVVNVLSETHEELSNAFARSGGDKFRGVSWTPTQSGAPVLASACAWIECELRDEHDGGDHLIVVGRVLGLGYQSELTPLLFHQGRYSTPAPRPALASTTARELPDGA